MYRPAFSMGGVPGPRLPHELALARIGDADGVTHRLDLIRQPLPIQGRFHPNSHRCDERPEELRQCVERHRHSAHFGDDATGSVEHARGDVALMQIQPDERHPSLPKYVR
ncbi:MAG: hypothetical protein ACREON_02950 [Gemmatimonadaceae bacterium]